MEPHYPLFYTFNFYLFGVFALASALVFVTRETNTPLSASLGPTAIGLTLGLIFLLALATHASGWLTWFTFIFAGGYLTLAALAYFLHAYQPQMAADY